MAWFVNKDTGILSFKGIRSGFFWKKIMGFQGICDIKTSVIVVLTGLIEPCHEKTCLRVFDQVRLKPACSATEAS